MSFLRVRDAVRPTSPYLEVRQKISGRQCETDSDEECGKSCASSLSKYSFDGDRPVSPLCQDTTEQFIMPTENRSHMETTGDIHYISLDNESDLPPLPSINYSLPKPVSPRRQSIHTPTWINPKPAAHSRRSTRSAPGQLANQPVDSVLMTPEVETVVDEIGVIIESTPPDGSNINIESSLSQINLQADEWKDNSDGEEDNSQTCDKQSRCNSIEDHSSYEADNIFTEEEQQPETSLHKRRDRVRGRKLAMDISPEDRVAFRLMIAATQGHGMKSIRQWLQNRFSSGEILAATEEAARTKKQRMITPDNIPEFVIPPQRLVPRHRLGRASSVQHELNNNMSSGGGANTKRVCRKTASVPDGMTQMMAEIETQSINDSVSDPGYSAAVSMPHLRTKTSYGFTTVIEHPHTRRKESLLIGSLSAEKIKHLDELSKRTRSQSYADYYDNHSQNDSVGSLMIPRRCMSDTSSPRRYMLDTNSTVSSYNSPSIDESSSFSPAAEYEKKRYRRRRSSLPPSVAEDSDVLSPGGMFYQSIPDSISRMSFQTKHEAGLSAPHGELKFSLQYKRASQQLHLTVIKAENLMKGSKDIDCNSYVKVYLESSGKTPSRHQTDIVRGNTNPAYNSFIILKNMTLEDLETKSIRLRVCNKVGSGMNIMTPRNNTLGEVLISLHHLNLQLGEEVRMWRDLERASINQALGTLGISITLDPREEKLYLTVGQAQNLSVMSVTGGLPDTYVRVSVLQNSRPEVKKQTRLKKNSAAPSFNETFVFSVSPKLEDLYQTSIYFRVMSKERIRNDTVIGGVVLGNDSVYGSDEENHWNNLLNSHTKDIELTLSISPHKE